MTWAMFLFLQRDTKKYFIFRQGFYNEANVFWHETVWDCIYPYLTMYDLYLNRIGINRMAIVWNRVCTLVLDGTWERFCTIPYDLYTIVTWLSPPVQWIVSWLYIYGLKQSHTVSHGLVHPLVWSYTDMTSEPVFSLKNHTRITRIHSNCPIVTRIRPRLVRLYERLTRVANRISRVFCVRVWGLRDEMLTSHCSVIFAKRCYFKPRVLVILIILMCHTGFTMFTNYTMM